MALKVCHGQHFEQYTRGMVLLDSIQLSILTLSPAREGFPTIPCHVIHSSAISQQGFQTSNLRVSRDLMNMELLHFCATTLASVLHGCVATASSECMSFQRLTTALTYTSSLIKRGEMRNCAKSKAGSRTSHHFPTLIILGCIEDLT